MSRMSLTFYAHTPPTPKEVIDGTSRQPCGQCGALVAVLTIELSDEIVRRYVEVSLAGDQTVRLTTHDCPVTSGL